ncbi:MAG: hypothetical protein R3E51_10430 [Rhizobiaceae bacterium]
MREARWHSRETDKGRVLHLGITLSAYSSGSGKEARRALLTLQRLGGVSSLLGVSAEELFHNDDRKDTSAAATGKVRSSSVRRYGKAGKDPKLLQIEHQLKILVILAEGHPLLKHLLSMAAVEAQEIAYR